MECLEEAQFPEAAICQLRQGISHLVIPSEAEGSPWQEGKRECEIGGKKEALPRCMGRQVSCQAVEPSGKKTVVQGGFLGCARNDDTGERHSAISGERHSHLVIPSEAEGSLWQEGKW